MFGLRTPLNFRRREQRRRTKKQALENITQVVKLVLESVEQPQAANAAADEKGQQAVQLLAATAPGE